jgi:hypothetical protein
VAFDVNAFDCVDARLQMLWILCAAPWPLTAKAVFMLR